MQIPKQDKQAFYDFYRLMNERGCAYIPVYQKEKSTSKDVFALPGGKKVSLPFADKPDLYPQALKALAEIDTISEEALGGRIYFFPELTNRSFYAIEGDITGIAPTLVSIGERYDNLAEFLSQAVLFIPYYQAAGEQVKTFATSLKEYGIKKKDLRNVLESFKSYFQRSASLLDKKTERGKQLYANAQARIVWIDLFADEIKEQFK